MVEVKFKKIPDKYTGHMLSFKGYFNEAYHVLVSIFGKPNGGPSVDNKVLCEWIFKINGEVGFIYNYKTGINYDKKYGKEKEDIMTWHIGGRRHKIVGLVKKYCITKGYLFLNRITQEGIGGSVEPR